MIGEKQFEDERDDSLKQEWDSNIASLSELEGEQLFNAMNKLRDLAPKLIKEGVSKTILTRDLTRVANTFPKGDVMVESSFRELVDIVAKQRQ